jgi:hypothetical protein
VDIEAKVPISAKIGTFAFSWKRCENETIGGTHDICCNSVSHFVATGR